MPELTDIDEIYKRLINYGPYEWVNPSDISGIDANEIREKNKKQWFRKLNIEDADENDDEEIVDYLTDCLAEQEREKKGYSGSENSLDINGIMLVEVAITLICEFGSHYAGTHFAMFRKLIDRDNAQECLNLLQSAYENSEYFIKDIIRDFTLEVFEFGPLWKTRFGKFENSLDKKSVEFLEKIFQKGYHTINNKDGRVFINGTKRI